MVTILRPVLAMLFYKKKIVSLSCFVFF